MARVTRRRPGAARPGVPLVEADRRDEGGAAPNRIGDRPGDRPGERIGDRPGNGPGDRPRHRPASGARAPGRAASARWVVSSRPPILAVLSVLFTLLGAAGCSVPEPAPRDRFYVLAPEIPMTPSGSEPLAATLLVRDLAARGFLGGRQILYRTREQPLEIRRYDLLLWEEPAGRAIAGALALALEAAALFEFVVLPAQGSRADFVLGGNLERFEHLPTAERPTVTADFTLTLVGGRDRRPLFSRRYQGTEPTAGQGPEDLARAFNRLAGRLIGQAVQDIADLVRRRGLVAGDT